MVIQGLAGIVTLIGLAWLFSEKKRIFPWRSVLVGLSLQVILVAVMMYTPGASQVFNVLNLAVVYLQEATQAGTGFVFGYLGGGKIPFEATDPGATFIFGFMALPLVLVVSALSAVLYYWRILPQVVRAFAWFFNKTLKTGGAVGVSVSANIFVGMIEAPLFITPYLARLTRSELFTVMTCGMATVAGTVIALYSAILRPVIQDSVGHILIASIISVPAAIMFSQIMIPETEESTEGSLVLEQKDTGFMDAITRGASDGMHLLLQITAMLVVLVALVHLVNIVLGLLPDIAGAPISLERGLGWIMAPVTWLMGVPWSEAPLAGQLMGMKTILNELLAYLKMASLPPEALSPRSRLIMTYAMCGFANFGSLGIMIGGMSAMVPERRQDVVDLGLKSIVSGTLSTCMTGCMVGLWV